MAPLVDARTVARVIRGLVVTVALVVALVLVLATVAVNKGHKVDLDCGGPKVSTPLADRGLDAGAKLGDLMSKPDFTSPWKIVKTVFAVINMVKMWLSNIRNHAQQKPEDSAATGWRNGTRQEQQQQLASCCVTNNQTDPSPAPPPPAEQPWDPKSASLQNLTGENLAADALRRAGFPASEIPMGVAVAKRESGWNPVPPNPPTVNGSTMRGMWQINWNVHPEVHGFGDWRDPYVNARMALSIWKAAGNSWSPWSTANAARQHVGEYQRHSSGGLAAIPAPQPAPPTPQSCPQPPASEPNGDLSGPITQIATLNPQGAGNWQAAVKDGANWYVAHATSGDRTQVIHRVDANGRELDQLTLAGGWKHATSFAVVGGVVYATDRQWRVVGFPYQPGATIRTGTPTGWKGYISKDPASNNVVIRNGNKYNAYNFTTHQQIGQQVTTRTGPRQGFSISGTTLYVLTGPTNQAARVDTYSFQTGRQIDSRDITHLGATEAGRHREPEGLYGNWVGIKTNTGDRRRLRIYQLNAATPSVGNDGALTPAPDGPRNRRGLTPRAQYAYDVTMRRWGCATKPAPCISRIGGYANRNIGGTNIRSDHATGTAIDIMVSARTNRQLGDDIAAYFQQNRVPLNVKYVIWNRRIWSPARGTEGWRPYNGASNHTDHVHVSVNAGTSA